jgi:dipeptidyl aminopeptidase/acylaminoacyl peptidase
VTSFPDNVRFGVAYQPRTGDSFILLKDTGGDENFQILSVDLASGKSSLVTDGKSRNTSDVYSHSGEWVAYASNKRNGNDMDIWVARPEDPKSARLLAVLAGGGFEPVAWSQDDRQLLVVEEISATESYLHTIDVTSTNRTLITPKTGEKVSWSGGVFTPDGKGAWVTTDQGSEFARLAYLDFPTKKAQVVTSDLPWDVDSFDLTHDGKLLAFTTNEDGLSVLHLLDTATKKERPRPAVPAGVISGVKFHQNGRDLAFTFESANTASDAYSLDVVTGKVDRWTFSETGGLDAERFAKPELVKWKSFDGKSISGWLYRPPKTFSGKRPVVISIHGGPEAQFRPGFQGPANYQIDVLGAARICPNVRGSAGYGKTFLSLDDGFKREDSYKDISTLLDWVKTQPDLDASRVMVTGGSYGGFMTLAVATSYADRIRCALDVVGPSNLVTFLETTSGYRRDLRRVEYGDERDPRMREFLLRIAPAKNAQKITKPLFVVQGKNDPRVPYTESEQMVATVRKNGTPVWFLMAKDEGHGFQKKPNTDFQLYASVLFMKEFLLK